MPAGVPLGDLARRRRGRSPCASSRRTPGTCAGDLAEGELRKLHARGDRASALRVGGARSTRSVRTTIVSRADGADRVRQHPERRQPHPLGLARSPGRLRRRPAGRPLPEASRSRLAARRGDSPPPPRSPPGRRRQSDTSWAIRRRRCVASAPVSKIRRTSSSRMNVAQSERLTTNAGPRDAPSPAGRSPEEDAGETLPDDDAREQDRAEPGRHAELGRAARDEGQVPRDPGPVRRQERGRTGGGRSGSRGSRCAK